jgi:hypothetical protein
MPLAVATQSAFRRLFCVIAQRDNPMLLFRSPKLAATSSRELWPVVVSSPHTQKRSRSRGGSPRLPVSGGKNFRAGTEGLYWRVSR